MQIRRSLCFLRNLLYILTVLIILLGIMFLYVDYSAQIPFKLVADIMLIQLVLFRIFVFRIRASLSFGQGRFLSHGEQAEIVLHLNKRSWFPYKRVEYTIRYQNRYDGKIQRKRVKCELNEKKEQFHMEKLGSWSCGIYEVVIESVILFDMFGFASAGILRRIRPDDRRREMIVLPMVHELELDENMYCCLTNDEVEDHFGEDGDETAAGLLEVRPFLPGDKLNRIHWKLSAKEGELIVRDQQYEFDSLPYVFFTLSDAVNISQELEEKMSVCAALLKSGSPVYMVWYAYDSRRGDYRKNRKMIRNLAELEEGVIELMQCPIYSEEAAKNMKL